MYTEEELLEALNILMEEYGYDEDEAIDMINEAFETVEIDEVIDILVEEYGYDEDEAIDIFNETFMDDVEDTYEGLKKKNPGLAGAVKGATYAFGGSLGGAAYGIHKVRRSKREGTKVEKNPIIKRVGKGLGYGVIGLATGGPVIPAVVGSVRGYIKGNNKYKKEGKKIKKEKVENKKATKKEGKKVTKKEKK